MPQTPQCKPWCDNHIEGQGCRTIRWVYIEQDQPEQDSTELDNPQLQELRESGKGLHRQVMRMDRIGDGAVLDVTYLVEDEEEQAGELGMSLELRSDELAPDDPRLGIIYLTFDEMKELHAGIGALISEVEANE